MVLFKISQLCMTQILNVKGEHGNILLNSFSVKKDHDCLQLNSVDTFEIRQFVKNFSWKFDFLLDVM